MKPSTLCLPQPKYNFMISFEPRAGAPGQGRGYSQNCSGRSVLYAACRIDGDEYHAGVMVEGGGACAKP
jgi:hypothetical protein